MSEYTTCEKHEIHNCALCKPAPQPAAWDGLTDSIIHLKVGDYVERLGGKTVGSTTFKAYVVKAKIEEIFMTKKARTQVHVKFEGKKMVVLDYRYPAQYRREV